jgi:hypothetical protein
MMTLRPKNSLDSVIGRLATGLSSGTIRLSTDSSESAGNEQEQVAHFSKIKGKRHAAAVKDDSVLLRPIGSSLKK